ncbi:progonadoliberin-1-like [Huso huso]|uniref:Progonadoliberin n=1 Tax=Huso huso TaxID=61971 RepID=A0ABR0YA10_HUSHU
MPVVQVIPAQGVLWHKAGGWRVVRTQYKQQAHSRSTLFTALHTAQEKSMAVNRGAFVWLLLSLMAVSEVCYGQHWSYGLRPGGKREAESLLDTLQEIADIEKLDTGDHSECALSSQRSQLSGLKGVLARLVDGESARKKI